MIFIAYLLGFRGACQSKIITEFVFEWKGCEGKAPLFAKRGFVTDILQVGGTHVTPDVGTAYLLAPLSAGTGTSGQKPGQSL